MESLDIENIEDGTGERLDMCTSLANWLMNRADSCCCSLQLTTIPMGSL